MMVDLFIPSLFLNPTIMDPTLPSYRPGLYLSVSCWPDNGPLQGMASGQRTAHRTKATLPMNARLEELNPLVVANWITRSKPEHSGSDW